MSPSGGSSVAVGRPVLRVYDVVRSAHLERDMVPGDLIYRKANYDFDPGLATGGHVWRRGRIGMARAVFALADGVVEVNEPAMVRAWPTLLAVTTAAKISNLLRRGRLELVSYAIENADIAGSLASRFRLPRPLARLTARGVVGLLFRSLDRCAFGTAGSRQTYLDLLGAVAGVAADVGARTQVFPALPSACPCLLGLVPAKEPVTVFLGDFAARKGVTALMAAWPTAGNSADRHTLLLMGKGELTDQVTAWAADRPEVEVLVDPPRESIHSRLADAKTLVLLSQPHPRWREQVGLPILEGLAHGCEVVTTTETGIADWLRDNGHQVLPPTAGDTATTRTLAAAAARPDRAAEILHSLPELDTRLAADRWLTSGCSDSPEIQHPTINDCETN
ncbi:glycosyltransferase family 1 protein [Nakamurella silvestris]|nr:glycosyltransferase family 1 protein [Nakamurella silvestris]